MTDMNPISVLVLANYTQFGHLLKRTQATLPRRRNKMDSKKPIKFTLIVEYDNGDRQTFNHEETVAFIKHKIDQAKVQGVFDLFREAKNV